MQSLTEQALILIRNRTNCSKTRTKKSSRKSGCQSSGSETFCTRVRRTRPMKPAKPGPSHLSSRGKGKGTVELTRDQSTGRAAERNHPNELKTAEFNESGSF